VASRCAKTKQHKLPIDADANALVRQRPVLHTLWFLRVQESKLLDARLVQPRPLSMSHKLANKTLHGSGASRILLIGCRWIPHLWIERVKFDRFGRILDRTAILFQSYVSKRPVGVQDCIVLPDF
jgi:hypothetical protein